MTVLIEEKVVEKNVFIEMLSQEPNFLLDLLFSSFFMIM